VERVTAKAVSESLEAAIARLTESLSHAKVGLSPSEFAAFQRSVGLTIGRLSHELLDPIYAEHPDLAPPDVL